MGKPVPVQDLFQGALKLNKKRNKVWSRHIFPKCPSIFMTVLKTNYSSSLFILMG